MIIHTWNTENGIIEVGYHGALGLTVWHKDEIAGYDLSVEQAQELVNGLAGKTIWG